MLVLHGKVKIAESRGFPRHASCALLLQATLTHRLRRSRSEWSSWKSKNFAFRESSFSFQETSAPLVSATSVNDEQYHR